MSAVFSSEALEAETFRDWYTRFYELKRTNFDNTTGLDKDSLIKSFNDFMFEQDLRTPNNGLLMNVLKSGIEKTKILEFEYKQVPYHNLLIKKIMRDLKSLTKGGDTITSVLSIFGLSLAEILKMEPHQWKTIYGEMRIMKDYLQHELDLLAADLKKQEGK